MRWIFSQLFKWLNWKIVGNIPIGIDKAVLVIAPHTSNWDFFYGMITIFLRHIPAKFAIKKEAMFFPLGKFLKRLGAIPIDRSLKYTTDDKPNQVEMMAQLLQKEEKLLLIIAPEGTRSYAPRWKTGFYRIAIRAQVPIVLGYLDYAKKEAGIGPIIYPTGNIEEDIQVIQNFYKTKTAKYPLQGIRN